MAAYLKLDHVTKSFHRGSVQTDVLDDINLEIGKGEFVSIIGHSGCGKSTLLNLVAGLTRVTSGGVLLEQCEVNAPGPERAVVFQNHSLLPWLTVYDNVALAVNKVFGGSKTRARPSSNSSTSATALSRRREERTCANVSSSSVEAWPQLGWLRNCLARMRGASRSR